MRLRPSRVRTLLRATRATTADAVRGEDLDRASRDLIAGAVLLSNLGGLVVVVTLLLVVLPQPEGTGDAVVDNLVAGAVLAVLAFPLGLALGLRIARPVRRWLRESDVREPTRKERRRVVRLPLALLGLQVWLWGGAALVLFGLNLATSVELALELLLTVGLGGTATAAIAYLLAGAIGRAAVARALGAEGAPRRRESPGVTVRTLLAWFLGTGVPVVGALILGIFALVIDIDDDALARAVVALCGVALVIGGLAVFLLARSVAVPLGRLRDALDAVDDGDLETRLAVTDATEVGYAQAGFNRLVAGLREREELRDLFGRHVGRDVARRALEEGVELGGEERVASALFVDVIGSTSFAQHRDPGEVVAALNRFFAVVVEETHRTGGLVNKFEGDAALCVFGAPLALEDHAGAALAAARAMQRRLREELPELGAGVGVSCGRLVAGNIGSADRLEYTVIGDPVNEAARLTEVAKDRDGRTVASQATVASAAEEEARHWAPDGEVRLRGRDAATGVAVPRDLP